MLIAKWNPNDGDIEKEPKQKVSKGNGQSAHEKPNNIHNKR